MADGETESADALWEDWEQPPRIPSAPEIHLDGFDGPLDLLFDLAERTRLDLARISVGAFVDQVVDALTRLEKHVPLERRADWLVLATRFLVLRARLLFAGSPEAAAEAEQEAAREIARARDLQLMRAAASWLEARPQLGREVFARPRAGRDPRVASYMRLMEACLTVLQGREAQPQDAEPAYEVVIPAGLRLPEALGRMRRMLATMDGPRPLEAFLAEVVMEAGQGKAMLLRAGLAGVFLAALELGRAQEAILEQDEAFGPISIAGPL